MKDSKSARFVYYGLIGTFIALYLAVAFVSTLHAITFFQLANTLTLAIFLGAAFEIGQASVLFSILMTKNKQRTMAWLMMFLLTTLQVTANVFASFKFMDQSGTNDWTYWQRSILFWLEADSPEIYKVTIAWITGALLPIVALGLTALAADNLKLQHEDVELNYDDYHDDPDDHDDYDDYDDYEGPYDEPDGEDDGSEPEIISNEIEDYPAPSKARPETVDEAIAESGGAGIDFEAEYPKEEFEKTEPEKLHENDVPFVTKKPRGWHFKNEFIDDLGQVWNKGKYAYTLSPEEFLKKA